jgi:hypothetical protein
MQETVSETVQGKVFVINEYLEMRSSGIHRFGVFARKDIPSGTRLIEYTGRKVTKKDSSDIEDSYLAAYDRDPANNPATYIFQIDDEWDLDGDTPDNHAKFINHSCDPNCEADVIEGRVWIDSIREIMDGDEITYNYGFELNEDDLYDFKGHPCVCGSKRCVGYILDEAQWPRMKELLSAERK